MPSAPQTVPVLESRAPCPDVPGAGIRLHAHFEQDGQRWRRPVSAQWHTTTLNLPAPPAWLQADWARRVQHDLALAPGDVEVLPWGQMRRRWVEHRQCQAAVAQWLSGLGLGELLADSAPTLMVCLGARYHHDAEQYSEALFCNLFLSDDAGLDLHFPATGQRLPLQRGTAVLFDPSQPHGVVARHAAGFEPATLSTEALAGQVFMSWELRPDPALWRRWLGVLMEPDPAGPGQPEAALRLDGAPVRVCPDSGGWRPAM